MRRVKEKEKGYFFLDFAFYSKEQLDHWVNKLGYPDQALKKKKNRKTKSSWFIKGSMFSMAVYIDQISQLSRHCHSLPPLHPFEEEFYLGRQNKA